MFGIEAARPLQEFEKVFLAPWDCKVFKNIPKDQLVLKVVFVAMVVLLTLGLALISFLSYAIFCACLVEIEVDEEFQTPSYPLTPAGTPKSIEVEMPLVHSSPRLEEEIESLESFPEIEEVEEDLESSSSEEDEEEVLLVHTSPTRELEVESKLGQGEVSSDEEVVVPHAPPYTPEMLETRKKAAITFFIDHLHDDEDPFLAGVDDIESKSFDELAALFDARRAAGSHRGFKLQIESNEQVTRLPEFMYAIPFVERLHLVDCPNIQVDFSRLPYLRSVHLDGCEKIKIDATTFQNMTKLESCFLCDQVDVEEINFTKCEQLQRISILRSSRIRDCNVTGCYNLRWCMILYSDALTQLPQGLDRSLTNLNLVGFTGCENLRIGPDDMHRIHPSVKTFLKNGHFYVENFDLRTDVKSQCEGETKGE